MDWIKKNWRIWLGVVISLLAVIFVVLQWGSISRSFDALKDADWMWVFFAVIAYSCSVAAAAGVYAFVRLNFTPYWRLLLAQASSLFTSRITPAGLGGIATMARVLITGNHTPIEAGAVVSTNALITFLGNVSLTILALVMTGKSAADTFKAPKFLILVPIFIIIISLVVWLYKPLKLKVTKFIKDTTQTVKRYETKKLKLLFGFLMGMVATGGYMAALWLVAQSLGVTLSPLAVIVTVSLGTLGATVTPLPGGLVGAEAALAATMVQFGVPAEEALAIALVYRLVTYWLPILPGYIATQFAFKKKVL
jgi:uncharacterized membrane protein YbhN (UPF0104 family)